VTFLDFYLKTEIKFAQTTPDFAMIASKQHSPDDLTQLRNNVASFAIQPRTRILSTFRLAASTYKSVSKTPLDGVSLILLEHPPVYTLNRSCESEFIKFDIDKTTFHVHRVERVKR